MISQLIGFVGAAFLLGGYVLVSSGRMEGGSIRYNVMNIAGALLLTWSGLVQRAWPSVTLNVVWTFIGLRAIATVRRQAANSEGSVNRAS
jgi:drug/metabolite transporter (DMT)-like permease